MTDNEKAALERRIDELCQENERLRKAKDTMHGDAFEIGAMLVKARDENAKLRRLVTDMCACFRISAEREGVSKQWCYELFDTYTRKLQKLGIEAD